MLTRRHIRAKVMQSVYAFVQSGRDNVETEQKNMLTSIDKIYDLYILMLNLLIEVAEWDKAIVENRNRRLNIPEEELALSEVLAYNRFTVKLSQNKTLLTATEDMRIGWSDKDEYLQILVKEIKESELFKRYQKRDKYTFKSDKNFMIDVFKDIIAPNEKIHEYIEGENISWLGDMSVANSMTHKTLTHVFEDSSDDETLMSLYKDNEDKEFAKSLFVKTVMKSEELTKLISEKTPGWDSDRIAQLDLIMMQMAVCEFLNFPSIPTKVSINEYLELSKDFSTPKSKVFINGVLDKLWRDLDRENAIKKSGRGLV